MAKRKLIIEIEYPDDYDGVWDHDKSGSQVFHDCIKAQALHGNLCGLKYSGCDGGDPEVDQLFQKYTSVKHEIIKSATVLEYFDSEKNEWVKIR